MLRYIKNRAFYSVISLILLLALILSVGCGKAERTTTPMATRATTTSAPTATRPPMTTVARPTITSPNMAVPQPTFTVTVPPATYAPGTTPRYTSSPPNDNLGFSVGGAKDIQSFRDNIKNNYLPLPTDVTYEGLFYDYYFDTGVPDEADKLFCPAYSTAVTRDPISGEIEYYLSVGLNSGMKESDFARKKLNLVIVMDVSGSMSGLFDSYYYDRSGQYVALPDDETGKEKIQVENECVVALLDQLNGDDSFGVVLFNQNAEVLKPLGSVDGTNMRSVKNKILGLSAGGSTNLDAGIYTATEQFDGYNRMDADEYENRIIVLTDAQPNQGDTSKYGLLGMAKANAGNHIYSTFIGIGLDFNSELIDGITKTRGANYYTVHSAYEFRHRIVDEFDYMVTPLIFDLQLNLIAKGWDIEEVYGSPEANKSTGELMKINTLFPSKSEGGETRGGLVLLKLKKTGSYDRMVLKVSYEDRNGNYDESTADIRPESYSADFFENSGIRKGVLLTRYADLLQNWMIDERSHAGIASQWEPCINDDDGIISPSWNGFSEWERQSMPLTVSRSYEHLFSRFLDYFKGEANAIGDDTLDQETHILETLTYK